MKKNASHNYAISLKKVSVVMHDKISLRRLFSSRPAVHSLDNVSFDIEKNQIFGVIGRNGAGKTTLLRTIAGIISPDSGRVFTYGQKACMLSIQSGFFKELSGRENAFLGGMFLNTDRRLVESNIEKIHAFSELGDFFDRPISTYSSGMLSRLGFAIAVYNSPDLVMMDEILSVGDMSFKEKSKKKMHDFLKGDKTILLVSNNPETIRDFAKQAIWLERGQVVLKGSAEDVADKYKEFSLMLRDLIDAGAAANDAAKEAIRAILT